MIKKTLFILSFILTVISFGQSAAPDTLVLKNKYSNGSVKMMRSDSGIMNKFIFIDQESKIPISGIVAIFGKKGVSYYTAENGIPKQAIMKMKKGSSIQYEITNDKVFFSENYVNNELKSVYTVIKSEDKLDFYQYNLKRRFITLKHSFHYNGKLKTERKRITEIPSSHRLPMDQFKL